MMQRISGGTSSGSMGVPRRIPGAAARGVQGAGKSCRSTSSTSSNCSQQHTTSRLLHHVRVQHQPQHQHQHKPQYYQQVRGKKTSSKSSRNDKLRSINRTLEAQKENHTTTTNNNNTNEYIFGLKPVDVTILPPLYRPPPPPPPKPGMQRFVFPFTLFAFGGTVAYFYFNNQNDAHEYWDAMQTGGVAPGTYDDDDDDDDDDFDDEEEE